MQMNSLTLCHKVSHNRQTTFSCDVTILIFSLTGNKKGQNDNMLLRTTYKQTNKAWFDTTWQRKFTNVGVYSFSSVTEGTIKKLQNSVKFLYRGGSRSPTGPTVSNSWKWLTNVSVIYQQLIRHFQS